MTTNIAVDVVDVSKTFRLYHEKYYSIKNVSSTWGTIPMRTSWH